MRRALLRSVRPIHEKFRSQKIAAFLDIANGGCPTERLLDVGGGPGINGEFLPLYARFQEVVVVNIQPQNLAQFEGIRIKELVADGCKLPFGAGAFDWVFSNAVIEHVGGSARQEQFADEIRRVARKGYFVATPNRHFPVDPHTLLPFYQFLSPRWQSKVCRFSPGYLREYEPIDLLSAGDLRRLFPGAIVQKLGLWPIPNNLVAYRSAASSD
jgi:ubiquinone/menaquinone biosynthesis C-methylase UbiE